METQLQFVDWLVILAYFVAVGLVVWWGERGDRHTRETSAGYFLADRNVGWFIIGSSLFASNIGAEHLVGLAGAGASTGVVFGQYECQASVALLLLGWLFVPFYLRTGVYTMPEFLERRYGPAARWYLAVISIIAYVLTKISVTIAAGGIVFEALGGVNFWTGAVIVVLATGVYTIFGGLRAVLYTDMFQMFVLIGGSIAVMIAAVHAVGGWGHMCAAAGPDMMSMWKPMTDPAFPWTGILFGAPIVAIWYWCTDQFIVQRVLSARGIHQARVGTIFAGYLKQLPLFIFVIPGVAAYCLFKAGKIDLPTPDQALPRLIGALLPVGLKGLVMAGLLAALMSSLSSVFNSCSTLVTIDVYKKLRPQTSERRLVLVGQVSTAILVGLGLAWIPFMKLISGEIYQYLQSVQAYISPPIAAVFLVGVTWKRVNGKGAMTALIAGFVLGAVRFIAELNKSHLSPGLLYDYATINFMHMAVLLFVVCTVLMVVVSLLTKPQPDAKLAGLTFATADQARTAVDAHLDSTPRQRVVQLWMTISVLAILGLVWLYFRK